MNPSGGTAGGLCPPDAGLPDGVGVDRAMQDAQHPCEQVNAGKPRRPRLRSRRQWIVRSFAACLCLASRAARPADAIAAADAVARVGDTNLVLNGAGLRKMFRADVYVIGLYLVERRQSAEAIFSAPGPKRISLRFVREVTAKALVQALYEGLRDNTSETEFASLKPAADMLSAMIVPFKVARKGDVVALDYLPASGSHVVVNGRRSETGVPGVELYAALLRIWIGEHPVDANLKRALLGA
jgi:Chalcone isomerase-like